MDETPTTRERLLQSALDLFSKKGFEATSVDEIAESIGIKGPNIYKYFKGKKGLFLELVNRTRDHYYNDMSFDKAVISLDELKEFSLRQIRFTISDETVMKMRKMYTIEQFGNEEIGKLATIFQYNNIAGLYKNIFGKMMEAGTIKKCDPELLALEYFAPATLMIQLCDREPERIDEAMSIIERHIDFFIDTHLR